VTLAQYRALLGIEKAVLVTPSVYGMEFLVRRFCSGGHAGGNRQQAQYSNCCRP
jgi:hypothetical protein